MLYIR